MWGVRPVLMLLAFRPRPNGQGSHSVTLPADRTRRRNRGLMGELVIVVTNSSACKFRKKIAPSKLRAGILRSGVRFSGLYRQFVSPVSVRPPLCPAGRTSWPAAGRSVAAATGLRPVFTGLRPVFPGLRPVVCETNGGVAPSGRRYGPIRKRPLRRCPTDSAAGATGTRPGLNGPKGMRTRRKAKPHGTGNPRGSRSCDRRRDKRRARKVRQSG